MMPLIRFLKKRGLKFKNANFENMRVEYFRLDMLREILETNQAEIASSAQLTELVELMKADLIYFSRPKNQEKRKYPQQLTMTEEGRKPKFASFKFDTTESKKWMLISFIVIVLAGVMFPLWPYELKYGAWLVSFTLLMVLLGIIVVRLVLYLVLAIFGISFWVFPNLFGDKGVIDSFKPFYSVEKWDKDVYSLVGRLIAFSIFIYYSYSIYNDPEFYLGTASSTQRTSNPPRRPWAKSTTGVSARSKAMPAISPRGHSPWKKLSTTQLTPMKK